MEKMKWTLKSIMFFIIGALVFSCSSDIVKEGENDMNIFAKTRSADISTVEYCGDVTIVDLIAGQYYIAGKVTVGNDMDNLYVTYTTENGWKMKELHLYVGNCNKIPVNPQGLPRPGRFPYKTSFANYQTNFTFVIPLEKLSDSCICVAAHAELVKIDDNGKIIQSEAAWGKGERFDEEKNWSMKFSYCKQKCEENLTLGIWLWGSTLASEGVQQVVDKLVYNNINDIYLLVKGTAGTKTADNLLTDFISKAHAKKMKVYLWYFVNSDKKYVIANPNSSIYHSPKPPGNLKPYPMNDERVNFLYPGYKEYVLDNIRYFLTNFDCDGIHLDGIRFGHFVYSFDHYSLQKASSLGCDTVRLLSFFETEANYTKYATNNGFVDLFASGDKDVVKWIGMRKDIISDYIKAIRDLIQQIKPGIELNAAFMPEGATSTEFSDVFYAQNYAYHSTILDMISPMAYFKSYGKSTSWLQTITEGAIKQVNPKCKIYPGLQSFEGVTPTQLDEQIQYSVNGRARGVVVFRYGTKEINASWDVLREWGENK